MGSFEFTRIFKIRSLFLSSWGFVGMLLISTTMHLMLWSHQMAQAKSDGASLLAESYSGVRGCNDIGSLDAFSEWILASTSSRVVWWLYKFE